MNNFPIARTADVVVQNLEKETLAYDLRIDKAFCLNETTAFIWQQCNGENSVRQIAALLQKKIRTPIDEAIVWFALEQLEKQNLMKHKVFVPPIFAGINRRQLIKLAGKSAAVAIPMIFAITVPKAAHAQSRLLANGSSCSNGSECQSGACNGVCCQDVDAVCTTGGNCCSNLCISGTCRACVLYDTPLTLADGRAIKAIDVFIGQELVGVNCMTGEKVIGRVKNKQEFVAPEIYSILCESGDVVRCSPSHPLIAGYGDKDGTPIENFKAGDPLLIYNEYYQIAQAKTTAVERIKIPQPVVLFGMDSFEHTFVSGGIVSHNK